MVKVIQSDRDAGADFWAFLGQHGSAEACRSGKGFRDTAQMFAAHREASQAELVEALEAAHHRLIALCATAIVDGKPASVSDKIAQWADDAKAALTKARTDATGEGA